jgi:hypothetical protein
MSRAGCAAWALVWLCVMTVPFLALLLAMRGELTWRRGGFVEDRLWLVNAETGVGNGSASGIGYSATRVVSDQIAADGRLCVRTNVYFLLWKGKSEGVTYCECYVKRPAEGGSYESDGNCP